MLVLQVSAIESLLVAEGVEKVIGFIKDEVDATTTQEDIDSKVMNLSFVVLSPCCQSRIRTLVQAHHIHVGRTEREGMRVSWDYAMFALKC